MIEVIRSSTALPRTQTVIRDGDVVVPWTMPTERQQRRRWREYCTRSPACAEGDA